MEKMINLKVGGAFIARLLEVEERHQLSYIHQNIINYYLILIQKYVLHYILTSQISVILK